MGIDKLKYGRKNELLYFQKKGFWARARGFFVLFFILAFLAIIAIGAGWWVFGKYFNEEKISDIDLKLTGPTESAVGQKVEYLIDYRNLSNIPLEQAELVVMYPKGTVEITSSPMPNNEDSYKLLKSTWTISQLAVGASGGIKINCRLIGEAKEEKLISATIVYHSKYSTAPFKKNQNLTTVLLPAQIEFQLSGKNEVFLEEDISYEIFLKNISEEKNQGIKIEMEYPASFVILSSDPAMTNGKNIYLIDSLDVLQEMKFKLKGYFKDVDQGEQNLKAKLYLAGENGDYFLQEERNLAINIQNKDDLSLNLLLNGSTESSTVNFGDLLDFSLVYENKSGQDFADVSIKAVVETNEIGAIDLKKIKDANEGKVDISSNVLNITWTKDNILSLAKIPSKGKGVLTLGIPIKTVGELTDLTPDKLKNLSLTSYFVLTVKKINEQESRLERTSNKFTNSVNTDLSFMAKASEPDAGEADLKFGIIWRIQNNIHDVENAVLKTKLPVGVEWLDEFRLSAGTISFSPTTREVIWQVNKIPSNLGKSIDIDFSVKINSSLATIGQVLTEEAVLTAKDATTGTFLQKKQKAISYKK